MNHTYRKDIRRKLSLIIINGEYTEPEYARIKKFVIDNYKINTEEFTIGINRSGLFVKAQKELFNDPTEFQLISQNTEQLQAATDMDKRYAGMFFTLDFPGTDMPSYITAFYSRCSRISSDGSEEMFDTYMYYGNSRDEW